MCFWSLLCMFLQEFFQCFSCFSSVFKHNGIVLFWQIESSNFLYYYCFFIVITINMYYSLFYLTIFFFIVLAHFVLRLEFPMRKLFLEHKKTGKICSKVLVLHVFRCSMGHKCMILPLRRTCITSCIGPYRIYRKSSCWAMLHLWKWTTNCSGVNRG